MLVELNGRVVPLTECMWLWLSPNQCVLGSVLADVAPTWVDAEREFVTYAKDRYRLRAWGFDFRLVHSDDWPKAAGACMRGECEHPRDHQACRRCGRIGRQGFQTVVSPAGSKPRLVCAVEKSCRARWRVGMRPNW